MGPDYYNTADAGYINDEGYVFVMRRTDNIITAAGHRLLTGAMEEVLANLADIAECAVIGVYDALKGQVAIWFLVLNAGFALFPGKLIYCQACRFYAFDREVVIEKSPWTIFLTIFYINAHRSCLNGCLYCL